MWIVKAFMSVLLACALLSCGREPAAPATAPAAATSAQVPSDPFPIPLVPRIVSTVPAATLNLVLIGAADQLVGVTKYDTLFLPETRQHLPIVGDYETMDYEQLVALKPTALVIQMAEVRISPRLRELAASHHIELVNLRFDHIDDIWQSVRTLGRIAGREQAALAAIDRAKEDLRELAIVYSGGTRPKSLYLVSPNLMLVAGGKTFIDEMITLAGGENIGAKAGEGFLEVGREAIVKLEPDVLLVGAADEIGMQADDPRMQPWLTLPVPAARNHRVFLVTDGNALMASVDIGKNVRMLADMIHRGESLPANSVSGGPPGIMDAATKKAGPP
jgi:iron complex transport system substrate-binding protein